MKVKSFFILALALIIALPSAVSAMTYRDVPYGHAAYAAVDWVSNPANGSFMVGDAANNFNPNRNLDKFETAKIFAVAAGYKYAAAAISTAERELFDRSYAEWKSYLDSMAAQYSKWSKSSDREIAYLLYKNILTVTDVSSFVTRINNAEQVNLLTRQEGIVYMVRLDGKQSTAELIALPYHTPYRDDAQIRSDYKKYIYYAKEAGIAGGSDGYISPTRNFTRAEMAQMFYNVFANRAPEAPVTNPGNNATNTVTGTVDYVYMNTHVYINSGGQPNAYKLANNVVILVNNVQRTAADLVKGMAVTAVISNGEIISLVANSQIPSRTPEPSSTPRPTSTPAYGPTSTPAPIILYEAEGYVTDVSTSPVDSLKVRTQRVKLYGEVISEERIYTLADTCIITRGGEREFFSDINEDDIVTIRYSGSVLYNIELEEKDRTVFGTLIEKKTIRSTNTRVLVIEDEENSDTRYELRVTNTTSFRRNSRRNLNWDDLRVGDEIEAECEYDRLISVYADGRMSTVRGELIGINISDNVHEITIENDGGNIAVYQLPSDVHDIYSLRVGENLTLRLDSWEVYSLTLRGNDNEDEFTIVGIIEYVRSNNRFDVEELDTDNPETYRIRVNANTVDEDTNDPLDFGDLEEGMEVYIILDEDADKEEDDELLAESIQILSY